jgi:hypothetical protein
VKDRDGNGIPDWADTDPYKRSEIPESVRLSPQWINENPQNQKQVQRRRNRAQRLVVEASAYAYGNEAAGQLAYLAQRYPGMSPGALTGLVHGQQFVPKSARNIPDTLQARFAPVRSDLSIGEVAAADSQARAQDGSLLPNEPPPPKDQAPGLLGKLFGAVEPFTKILQFGSTGFVNTFGYPMQAYTNLARQYYGDIDAALDLQKQAGLDDDQLREIVGDDVFARAKNREGFNVESLLFGDFNNLLGDTAGDIATAAVQGLGTSLNTVAPGSGLLFNAFASTQGDVARNDQYRQDGLTVEGSPSYRKGWAKEQWDSRVTGTFNRDQLWRRTALGEWWNATADASSPLDKYTQLSDGWLGVAEYGQVDAMERGLVDGFNPTYNLYTEAQKRDQFERLQQRMREADAGNFQIAQEDLIALTSARPWTWGKGAMMSLDEDPDSIAQKYGSGLVDGMIALADPSGLIPFGKIGTAAKLRVLTKLVPQGKTATISALRTAARSPEMAAVQFGPEFAEVADYLAKQRTVSPEAANAARNYLRAKGEFEQHLHQQRVASGVGRTLEFDDAGNAIIVGDNNLFRLQTSGIRTPVGDGWQIAYANKAGDRETVQVVPRVARDGSVKDYAVKRFGANQTPEQARTVKTFGTVEEADDFAKGHYLQRGGDIDETLRKGYRQANVGPEQYLADLLAQARTRRAGTLRLADKNPGKAWNIVDDSLEPFTNVDIRLTDTRGATREVSVGGRSQRVVERADGKHVVYEVTKAGDNGRRLHVADTAAEADEWVANALHPVPSGRKSDLRFTRDGDVWEAPGYTIVRDLDEYGDDVYRLSTFDGDDVLELPSLREAQVEARAHAATSRADFGTRMRTTRKQAAPFYGVYDNGQLISSHNTLGEATKAGKRAALDANQRMIGDLGNASTRIEGQSAIGEGVSVVDDTGNRITVPMDQDAEMRLLSEFDTASAEGTERLAGAYEYAQAKLSTETFVSNGAIWEALENTVWGQKLINIFVNATSPDEIMRMIPGMKIDDARALAFAGDEDTIKSLLGQMIGPKFDPGSFAAVDGLRRSVVQAKYKLGNTKLGNALMYRPFLFAPAGRMVDATDGDEIYWEARRYGEGLGILPKEMGPVLDALVEADTPVARYEAFYGKNGFLEKTVREHLRALKVSEDDINDALNVFKGAENIGQRNRKARQVEKEMPGTVDQNAVDPIDADIEDLRNGEWSGPLIVGRTPEEVLFTDELLSKGMMLPDYRTVKRLVSPLARAETRIKGDASISRFVGESLNRMTSIWRNWTLISGARAVRDVIDMQVRVALAGGPSMLQNPATFVGTLMVAAMLRESSTLTREVMVNIPLMGIPAAMKVINKRLPGMDQQMYRNSFLVRTDTARGLADPMWSTMMYDDATEWQGMSGKYARNTDAATMDRGQLATSVTRNGIVEPIEVIYDQTAGKYAIANGRKRMQAALDTQTPYVPIRVSHGRVTDDMHAVDAVDDTAPWHSWKAITGSEDGYVGGVEQVVKKARSAVAKDRHWTVGVWALSPLLDRQWASVNGKSWYDDLNRMLSGEQVSMEDMNRLAHQTSTAMGNWQTDESLRNGTGTFVQEFSGAKNQPKQHRRYAESLADRLGELRLTEYLPQVYAGNMSIDEAIDKIMRSPRLRSRYNAMYKSQTGLAGNQGSLADTLQALKEEDGLLGNFIREQLTIGVAAASLFTGKSNYDELTQAFITGRFEGAGLSSANRKLVGRIRSILKEDQHALPQTVEGLDGSKLEGFKALVDRMFSAQGEVYDLFAMHPMQRKLYVDEVERLMVYATPQARQKMIKNTFRRGDRELTKRVSRGARRAGESEGFLGVEEVEALAQQHAADKMKEIFYDAHARQNYALAMRVVAPFLQSAVNTVYTWGKLVAKNPQQSYRAFRNVRALLSPEADAISELLGFEPYDDDPYAVGDGFGTVDPQSGQRYFNYPVIGKFVAAIANAGKNTPATGSGGASLGQMNATASAVSLNPWQSGIVPGLNPVVTAPLLAVNPDAPAEDSLMGRVLRLNGVNASDEQNRFAGAVQSLLPVRYAEMLSVGSRKRGDAYMNALANEIAQGGYDFENDPSAFEDAMARAEMKSYLLNFVEGFAQLTLPTAGSFNMQANVPVGQVGDIVDENGEVTGGANVKAVVRWATLKELSQQYLRYISVTPEGDRGAIASSEDFLNYTQQSAKTPKSKQITFKSGDDYKQGQAAFMKDYGPAALAGVQKIVDDDMRSPWTIEAWDFSRREPEWWNKYRNVLSGVFKTQDSFGGSVDARILQMQNYERSQGRGEYLTVDDINNAVKAEFADLWKANALQMASAYSGGVIDPSVEYRINDQAASYSNGATDAIDFDKLNKDLVVMQDALEDPAAPATPTSQFILDWLRLRGSFGEYAARTGQSKGQETGNPSSFGSMELWLKGQEFIAADKSGGFASFWARYGQKTFSEDFYAMMSGYGG